MTGAMNCKKKRQENCKAIFTERAMPQFAGQIGSISRSVAPFALTKRGKGCSVSYVMPGRGPRSSGSPGSPGSPGLAGSGLALAGPGLVWSGLALAGPGLARLHCKIFSKFLYLVLQGIEKYLYLCDVNTEFTINLLFYDIFLFFCKNSEYHP